MLSFFASEPEVPVRGESTLFVHLARKQRELLAVLDLGRELEGRSSDFVNVETTARLFTELLTMQELADSPRARRGVVSHRSELQLRPLRDVDSWDAYAEELQGPFLENFVTMMVGEHCMVRHKGIM